MESFQIENFSLQILHEPLSFSVAGFFSLDFMLLKAVLNIPNSVSLSRFIFTAFIFQMVAAITTYMVIFIQFMPKDESIDNVTEWTANQNEMMFILLASWNYKSFEVFIFTYYLW